MRVFVIAVTLGLSAAAFAEGEAETTEQRSTPAATTLEIDPTVIVMDIDDALQLTEDTAPKASQPAVAVQLTTAPRPPETRVIELDPPPVAIVNRTKHFRIVSRRPAERSITTAEATEESAEE